MDACHCKDYTRAAILRQTAARAGAGAGLRAIEPGMPLPAGTGLSRRAFLARSSGLALAVFGGGALAPNAFDEGIADAMGAARQNTVLVSIFLSGGLDTLALLAPADDLTYQQLRPTLKLAPNPANALAADPRLQWHPAALPLKALNESGRLTVVPAIGYSTPNQSHFTSRHFYEVGELNESGQVGWLGRWLDRNGRADNPLQGLSMDATLAPALAAAKMPVAAVASPTNFALSTAGASAMRSSMNQAYGSLGRLATADPALASARHAAAQVVGIQDSLAPLFNKAITDVPAGVAYPANSGFANKLKALAKMLHMGLPIRCVALDGNGGYDTHDNQAATLTGNLTQFSAALQAFQADLEGRLETGGTPLAERVLVHVWSEFGRRPAENGSGTDHGAAGASLLMGTPSTIAKPMQGEFPGVTTLDRHQNLRNSIDFRSVYKTLLENWLGGDISGVLPNASSFQNLGLIKAA